MKNMSDNEPTREELTEFEEWYKRTERGRMMDSNHERSPCNFCTKQHCGGHMRCQGWIDWFGEEWQIIRYMAGELKARRILDDKG